jgi:hypothetical protein
MPMRISPECRQSVAHQQENATSFVEHSFKMARQKSVIRAKFGQSGNKSTEQSQEEREAVLHPELHKNKTIGATEWRLSAHEGMGRDRHRRRP